MPPPSKSAVTPPVKRSGKRSEPRCRLRSPSRPTWRGPPMPEQMTYAAALREAMRLLLTPDERAFLAGEDIGDYGGAFGATEDLATEFGEARIRDTPITATVILRL